MVETIYSFDYIPMGWRPLQWAVAALSHPNICTLYDVGPDYLIMEYIHGGVAEGSVGVGDGPG